MPLDPKTRRQVRAELLEVIQDPEHLEMYARDAGLPGERLPLDGALDTRVDRVLVLCEAMRRLAEFLEVLVAEHPARPWHAVRGVLEQSKAPGVSDPATPALEVPSAASAADPVVIPAPGPAFGEPLRFLFISTSPREGEHGRVLEEAETLEAALLRAAGPDRVRMERRFDATVGAILEALERVRPHVVHIAGAGRGRRGPVLRTLVPDERRIPPAVLGELFELYRGSVRCVVLNTGGALEAARAVCRHVEWAVGLKTHTLDPNGMRFMETFGAALAMAGTLDDPGVGRAFHRAQLVYRAGAGSEDEAPVLVKRADLVGS